jgi:transcriptional regulator with XRE-family HTH domain
MIREKRGRPPRVAKDHLIRTIRLSMGLEAEELAELAGIKPYFVYRIEAGITHNSEVIEKIAKALNISSDIIFYSLGKIPKDKIELIKKDPLKFKEKVDEIFSEPWKLTATKDYIENIKNKVIELEKREKAKINPEISKILSKLKPTE